MSSEESESKQIVSRLKFLSEEEIRSIGSGANPEMKNATSLKLKAFIGHSHRVFSVVYSPDNRNIASGGDDRTIRI